jgi:gliding motility-associated-like protein
MNGFKRLIFIGGLFILTPHISFGQYILNGSATKESCNCYVLTTEQEFVFGSVWQSTKIDLTKPFDYFFDVYLGCKDPDGADGIVFILQPKSTSLGAYGSGLGFQGITPSVGVPLDTYKNPGDDPTFDHISIQLNGDIQHKNDLAGPVPASATSDNIEDCKWHKLRIVWNPATDSLSSYFDGQWRVGAKVNLVKDVFNDDPMVYWGFSGATGGMVNVQKFCTSLDPEFETQLDKSGFCLGTPVEFKNNSVGSVGISNYLWDFGDGNKSIIASPIHNYSNAGIYKVTHQFTSNDGCASKSFTRDIIIGDIPKVTMQVFDTCESITPQISTTTTSSIGLINQWEWAINNQVISSKKNPDFPNLAAGNYPLTFSATSEYGCKSNKVSDDFIIKPKPAISFLVNNACIDEVILFKGINTDNQSINKWQWQFEDGTFKDGQETVYSFGKKGNYSVKLKATGMNGCNSQIEQPLFINAAEAIAWKDTIVLPNTIFQLNAGGGSAYSWTPSTGLSNPAIANPIGDVLDDMRFKVKVTTVEGCTDTASVMITVFKGSAIYVPNVFTPNNDGLNDVLKPYFIGIKSLSFFTVYDRWGKKIYSTSSMKEGWSGSSAGKKLETGTYVWVLKAEDIVGKKYDLKGKVMIIK